MPLFLACHRLPRSLISFRCLLLNELIFWGAAIYWFTAGLHLQHMIFSHYSPGNSLHPKPQAMVGMLMQPLWDFLTVLQKLCKNGIIPSNGFSSSEGPGYLRKNTVSLNNAVLNIIICKKWSKWFKCLSLFYTLDCMYFTALNFSGLHLWTGGDHLVWAKG